jgi:hypothetical protein
MPARTDESPPPQPEPNRQPGSPREEVRSFETRRRETGVNRDTSGDMSLDTIYGDDINTHGSER